MNKPVHKQHNESQFFDEVHITTRPRWKESEISGDEWRYSARVSVKYKGLEILAFTMRNAASAIEHANTMIMLKCEGAEFDPQRRMELFKTCCDQEGCAQIATEFFEIHKQYRRDGSIVEPYNAGKTWFAKFCKRHSTRGDCGLEDADNNYTRIEDPNA